MISTETAERILEALGPDAITSQTMDAAELAEDLEAFQSERTYKNSYGDWLSAVLAIERIHLESDDSFNTPELVALRDDKLNQMSRRVYAVKLKGDDMKSTKKKAGRRPSGAAAKEAKTTKTTKAAKPKPVVPPPTPSPKVGDPGLATEADFTAPVNSNLGDYRYYALLDKDGRDCGPGLPRAHRQGATTHPVRAPQRGTNQAVGNLEVGDQRGHSRVLPEAYARLSQERGLAAVRNKAAEGRLAPLVSVIGARQSWGDDETLRHGADLS
jgi:hypothetical protein